MKKRKKVVTIREGEEEEEEEEEKKMKIEDFVKIISELLKYTNKNKFYQRKIIY